MKNKLKIFIIISVLASILLVFMTTNVLALETRSNENNVVTTSENADENTNKEEEDIYYGDLYIFFNDEDDYNKSTYVMDKNVDGNVFVFGQDVEITGRINGSLFVFCSTLTIEQDAYIGNHIFAYADKINMSGFAYDVYLAANEVSLTKEGTIYRDAKITANTAYLYGAVGRDIDIAGNNISVYKDGDNCLYLGRNMNYTSIRVIENIEKATINGEINYTEVKEEENTDIISNYIYDGIENTIYTIIIYGALLFLAPKFIEKSKEYLSTKGLLAAAIGAVFTILLPLIMIALLFTTIGVAVSITALMLYVVLMMINSAVVAITINEFVASKISVIDKIWKKLLMLIPISIIIFALRQIPYYVGGAMSAIILVFGVGIIVLYQFDKRRKENA